MLLQKNFGEEHIRELQGISHRDPVLLERAVYAFGLLEALAKVGMPFIFKGGTCLMLLMEHPRRLSTWNVAICRLVEVYNSHSVSCIVREREL